MMKKSIIALIVIAIAGFSFTFVNGNDLKKQDASTDNVLLESSSESMAQSGIKFSHISLDEAKKLSKKTGKPIFIDCYTTWCGPCKVLSSKVFTQAEVGAFFNKKFINLKLDMEKSADGRKVGSDYAVQAYPTLLFINDKGELQKKAIGLKNAEQLIQIGKSV